MIINTHPLPVKRQAELLQISRSNVYNLPAPTSEKDLTLMRAIDELHLEYPFLGARQLSRIARQGHPHAGRLHVGTLMAKMGITALYRKPYTSRRHPEHKVYPVSAAPSRDRAGQPRLGDGHHLFADGTGLSLPGSRYGLGDAAGAGVAGVKHADR